MRIFREIQQRELRGVKGDAAEEALSLFDIFKNAYDINKIFAQILALSDETTKRTLPTIPANAVLPASRVTAIRKAQIDLIEEATKKQIRQVRKIIKDNQGLSREALTEKLAKVSTPEKAKLWARDQTLKFHGAVTKQRHLDLGVKEYDWITSQDERVRDRHSGFSGRRFKYSDPPTSDSGEKINPGEDYNCRCTAFPVTPSSGLLGVKPDVGRIKGRQARAAKILPKRQPRKCRSSRK